MAFVSTNNDDYKNDIKLDNSAAPLPDAISSISWAPTSDNVFAATSWDGTMRVYEVQQGQFGLTIMQRLTTKFASPALKCCWNADSSQIMTGLSDGFVKSFHVNSGSIVDVAKHNNAISSLNYFSAQNTLISTAYDSGVMFWQNGQPQPIFSLNLENKVYTSDFQFPLFVAGLANEKMAIIDMNFMSNKTIVDSSDLGKFSQIQSIAVNHKCSTLGVASFDGRANISNIAKTVNGQYTPVNYLLK